MDRRSLLRGLGAVGACTSLRPSLLWAAPLEKVKALGSLRVGLYADNRPWSWEGAGENGGKLTGIDVDLAHALAQTLGVRADIALFMAGEEISDDLRNVVWRGGLLGFQPCDVMLHVPFDRQLMAQEDNVMFLAPYYRESFGAACGEAADCEAMPVRWKGRRIAAELDSVPDFYLLGHAGGALAKDVVHVPSGYEAVTAVGKGEADAAVATSAQIEAAMHDAPGSPILRRKGFLPAMLSPGWDIGIAVKENSRNLGFAIEEQFGAMAKDGRMKAIFAKYGVEWKPALATQTA